jgi:hypothetical protein
MKENACRKNDAGQLTCFWGKDKGLPEIGMGDDGWGMKAALKGIFSIPLIHHPPSLFPNKAALPRTGSAA